MTPNKHFNTYKEGLDLEVLREYCMEWGETLEEALIGYYFKSYPGETFPEAG